jgi:hypothetical protein
MNSAIEGHSLSPGSYGSVSHRSSRDSCRSHDLVGGKLSNPWTAPIAASCYICFTSDHHDPLFSFVADFFHHDLMLRVTFIHCFLIPRSLGLELLDVVRALVVAAAGAKGVVFAGG